MAVDIMSWVSVTSALVVGVVSLLAYWIWSSMQPVKVLQKMGLRGPRSYPLVGNGRQMMKTGMLQSFVDWNKKYGKCYGIVMANHPTMVISDVNMLCDLMVKKFAYFPNRFPQKIMQYKPWEDNLLQLRDDQWKHVRSQLSPTFSSGKLKKMMPAIYRVIENLDKYVRGKAETGEEVELKHVSGCFAMDGIAGAAFGMQVDSLMNPDDAFNINAIDMLKQNLKILPILLMFPWMTRILLFFGVSFLPVKATNFFVKVLDMALKERRLAQSKHSDFLQLLIDAEREGAKGPVDAEIDHSVHLTTTEKWSRKGMNDDEMRANGLVFFLAGYDTTSTVLSFTLFLLAANSEALQKVQKEIDEKLGTNKVNYENTYELTYLDMCVNEAMRLFPPGFLLDRQALEDVELGGYQVKKGMRMIIPAYAIHRDPDHWPEPDKFQPERHTPEAKAARNPFSFMPFGLGPRNCIGMRLAQLELRMALATLLQHHTPVLCDKSVYPPVMEPPQSRMVAKDGLWVKFKSRN